MTKYTTHRLAEDEKEVRLYEKCHGTVNGETVPEYLVAIFPKSFKPALYLAEHCQEYLQQQHDEIAALLEKIKNWELSDEETKALEENPAGAVFNPDWRSPPGDTIKEILEERGISVRDFAAQISMSEYLTEQLILGEIPLNLNIANRLHNALGASVKFWLNREAHYREPLK